MWQDIHHKIKPEEVELVRRDYVANEGWETFLSYEDTHQVTTVVYMHDVENSTCQFGPLYDAYSANRPVVHPVH